MAYRRLSASHISAIVTALLCMGAHHWLFSAGDPFDFSLYAQAGGSVARGQNPYTTEYVANLGLKLFSGYYFYPPLLAVALSWCVSAGYPVSPGAWLLLNSLCMCIGAYALSSVLSIHRMLLGPSAVIAICCFFPPTLDGLAFGQANPLVFAAVANALALLFRRRDFGAGLCVGLATALKMSPVLLLVTAIRFRRWKALSGFAFASAIAFLLSSLSPRGMQIFYDFMEGVHPLASGVRNWEVPENYALARLVAVLFGIEASATAVLYSNVLLGCCCGALFFWPRRGQSLWDIAPHFAIVVSIVLLVSPILWFHHLVWALIPLWVAWDRTRGLWRAIIVFCAFVLGASLYTDVLIHARFVSDVVAGRLWWLGPLIVDLPIVLTAAAILRAKE